MCYFSNLLLLLLVLTGSTFAENVSVSPPNNSEVLKIPQGTSITIKWDSQFSHLDLSVFQAQSGSFAYNTLLSNVAVDPGPASFAWSAANLAGIGAMHFEVTQASNEQSLNSINSGDFYVTNGSSVETIVGASTISTTNPTSGSAVSTTFESHQSAASTTLRATMEPTTPSPASLHHSDMHTHSTRDIGLGVGPGVGIPLFVIATVWLFRFREITRRTAPQDTPALPPPYQSNQPTTAPKELAEQSSMAVYEAESDAKAWTV